VVEYIWTFSIPLTRARGRQASRSQVPKWTLRFHRQSPELCRQTQSAGWGSCAVSRRRPRGELRGPSAADLTGVGHRCAGNGSGDLRSVRRLAAAASGAGSCSRRGWGLSSRVAADRAVGRSQDDSRPRVHDVCRRRCIRPASGGAGTRREPLWLVRASMGCEGVFDQTRPVRWFRAMLS
jgi:hypothetical protein